MARARGSQSRGRGFDSPYLHPNGKYLQNASSSGYRPAYRAHLFPEIDRYVSIEEYLEEVRAAQAAGLTNLDVDI